MSKLVILGASGHGIVAADIADLSGRFGQIVFLDQSLEWAQSQSLPFDCVATCDDFGKFEEAEFFVAYGGAELRKEWTLKLQNSGKKIATLVHPSATIARSASLGAGSIVCAQAVVNPLAKLGQGVIVNTGSSVDHHCQVGDFTHICPGARLAGNVTVGSGAWIGISSSVIQSIRIGERATIGAGAAVVRDIDDGLTVVGVPARPLKR